MKTRFSKSYALRVLGGAALICATLFGQSVMAQTVVVGTCQNASNTILKIQDGVNAAAAGSTIMICPGAYAEQVEIAKSLTLTGMQSGNKDAVIVTLPAFVAQNTVSDFGAQGGPFPTAAMLWVHDTTGVTVTNLIVSGDQFPAPACNLFAIYFENASGTVANVVTRNLFTTPACDSGFGVWVEAAPNNVANVTIYNNGMFSFDGGAVLARGAGAIATIHSNSIVGSTNSELNDITITHGATGTIADNSVVDAVNPNPVVVTDDLNDASCGIALGQTAHDVTISGNVVGNTQCGIALYGANNNTILSNTVVGTSFNDGVYVCGNGNQIMSNTITGSAQAGVHLSCAETFPADTANNNHVSKNVVNGACAGILVHSGTTGNILSKNTIFNVEAVSSTANTCP